jgi:hypothetical protein
LGQSLPQGQLRQFALRRCGEQRPEPLRDLCRQGGKDRLDGFAWRHANEVAAHQHQPTPVVDDALPLEAKYTFLNLDEPSDLLEYRRIVPGTYIP